MLTTAEIRCRSSSRLLALVFLFVALLLEAVCWGFTVDDAWIIARVAERGAETGNFSFNPEGPATDAITPLGFAQLLAALGSLGRTTDALGLWHVARFLGAASTAAAFACAGAFIALDRDLRLLKSALLAGLILLSLPAALWAGAGLSTGLVGLVLLLGARWVERRPSSLAGYLALGLPLAWRPELAFCVLALAFISARDQSLRLRAGALILSLMSFGAVCLVRWVSFGHALPLASIAKEADLGSGAFYAAVTVLWGGLPWLLLPIRGFWRGRRPWGWVFGVHLLALVYAGGDWMPALRLTAPLYPWLVWKIGAHSTLRRGVWFASLPAVAFPLLLWIQQGADLRAVSERRLALVEQGALVLRESQVIAATDVGWVGLASSGVIVDLGGVTDPTIARLPGGHTSKAVYPGLFSDRDVDTWVIRAADRTYRPGDPLILVQSVYAVDARLLARVSDLGFVGVATIPLAGTDGQYVIARRELLARATAAAAP